MAQLKLGAIKDLGGIGGFTFTSSGVTANGTLTVTDIVIDGNISGSSNYILPTHLVSQVISLLTNELINVMGCC
ncbi:MAG: hypothetical protein CM15mV7_0230 [uncultured marine virus]|nr:MAG: hypothetical protein CM15mV7_0230 [uncultured marine virus]